MPVASVRSRLPRPLPVKMRTTEPAFVFWPEFRGASRPFANSSRDRRVGFSSRLWFRFHRFLAFQLVRSYSKVDGRIRSPLLCRESLSLSSRGLFSLSEDRAENPVDTKNARRRSLFAFMRRRASRRAVKIDAPFALQHHKAIFRYSFAFCRRPPASSTRSSSSHPLDRMNTGDLPLCLIAMKLSRCSDRAWSKVGKLDNPGETQ